jgi:hypothetical protein
MSRGILPRQTQGLGRQKWPSLPQVRRLLGHSAFKQGDLVQVRHGDIPDDIRQALVEQRKDDDVQRGPLSLETEQRRALAATEPRRQRQLQEEAGVL